MHTPRMPLQTLLSDQFIIHTNGQYSVNLPPPSPSTQIKGYLLFMIFGFSPFIIINSIWSQIPILVNKAPEKQAIGSIIGTSFQLANIIPLVWGLCTSSSTTKRKEYMVIHLLMLLGIGDCIFIMYYWDAFNFPSIIHSWGISVGSLLAGLRECGMILMIWTFTARYKVIYTSALSAGLGFSGIIPTAIALIQNVGGTPLFDPKLFFLIILGFVIISYTAFCIIVHTNYHIMLMKVPSVQDVYINQTNQKYIALLEGPTHSLQSFLSIAKYPLCMQLWTNMLLFFCVPGLTPYIFKHNTTLLAWATFAFMVSNTAGRMICGFKNIYYFSIMNTVQTALLILLILFAFQIILVPQWVALIVLCIFAFLNGYTVTLVYIYIQVKMNETNELKSKIARWSAVCEQIGSFGGQLVCTGVVWKWLK